METINPEDYIAYIGPTWKTGEDGNYILPDRTLGWAVIAWIIEHLGNGETGDDYGPFIPTGEQARFLLWWYAIDEKGNWLYTSGQLQRLKGWGKDPLSACLCLVEALGECRFDGWSDAFGMIPKAKRVDMPLVQMAAVTQDQTNNTQRYFSKYLTDETVKKFKIEINTETVKSFSSPVIFSITSNPSALEGKSQTFCLINEPQHWTSNIANLMWKVISRNAAKVKGGTSRMLAITNAYDPNEGSVAQQLRDTYEAQLALHGVSKIMYDSVEISPDAPLFIYEKNEVGEVIKGKVDVEATRANIGAMIDLARGDSKWSDLPRLVDEFFDVRYPVDLNRRFWLNSIVSSEDAWIDVRDFDKCMESTEKADITLRRTDQIAIFFDGSKTGDNTVLVGCRISDGYIFKIASWSNPRKGAGPTGVSWLVPRTEKDKRRYDFPGYPNPYQNVETVDEAVIRAFQSWKVVAFFADPSHAREDVNGAADEKMYWDKIIEEWHIRYNKHLMVWAGSRSGAKSESINWDMSDRNKLEEFAEFAERVSEMVLNHELLIERDSDFRKHFMNARIYPTYSGLESIWKGKKNSANKIDLAVGAVGAFMLRSKYLKQYGEVQKKKYSSINRFE